MTEFPKCRFLETVLQVPTKGIAPEELQGQYKEFRTIAQDYLCGRTYFEVYDTFDTLSQLLDGAVGRKKKARS